MKEVPELTYLMNKKTILSSHFLMRAHIALALITVMVASPQLFAQQLNILVLGSTHSYSEREIGQAGVAHEKPFNPGGIASQLQSILAQDAAIAGTVNVTFEDIFKTKQIDTTVGSAATIWDLTYYSYSLIQHFMWPEGKDVRLADLRGEGTVAWDYIVLCEDPYIMANFPGMFAEGVKMIQNEVAKSASPAQVILLAQWPENSSGFSAGDFNEVVYRVGDSAGLPVVPSGKAWDAFTGQDTASAHPTPKGEYLAASAIYSRIFDRSAATSAYTYNPGGDAIANHAFSVVQANDGVAQYAGKYTIENPFQMKYYRGRQVDWNEYGTSTEEGFAGGLNDALSQARVGSVRRNPPASGNPVDLSYSRGNDWFEPEKQYRVDPAMHDRVHGFPMGDHRNTGPLTMRYGIDKRYYRNSSHSNGTDLGIAYSMVREGEVPQDVRGIPVRLMWAKINHFRPEILAYRDSWHLSRELDRAVGAYMFTLLTGRCPVEAEPAEQSSTAWQQWFTRKLGYETAWQMAHLTTRAPGFRVLPSATNATTITPGGSETMTVQFVNPPQQEVTVSVSISNSSAAIVGPQTLVFTPANYNIPQQVTVAGIPGATAAENFEVAFSTTSTDEIYDGLSDAWGYTINRSSTVSVSQTDNGTQQVLATQSTPVEIQLGVTGADAANTTFAGPANGSISWTGPATIEYTPTSDYLGSDYIAYAVTIGGTQTLGAIDLSVQVPNGQVNASASDAQASEEGPDTGSFVISRLGDATGALDIFFTLSGTATPGEDYTLSHTSPVTLPDGQSSVTLTLTPVDDTVFGERDESVTLTITPDAAYPIGMATASVTIADNDNRAPSASAGSDQSATLQAAGLVPGLYYGTVTGNIDVITPNPETQILVNVSSETENAIAANTTEIYTGNIYDADGQISFTEHIDDSARIWIDGVLVLSNDVWNARSSTANLNLAPGWHSIEIRIANGTGGSGPVNGEIGIGYDPAGGTTWQTLVDPGDGSFLRVSQISGVELTLSGSASDPDSDPLTTTWSVVSGPSPVTLGNASALQTVATFTATGTYVLRLTVDDGIEQIFDEVTVSVDNVSDSTPPTLASSAIVDDQSGADIVEGTLVTYTLSFSEDMDAASVDTTDFANTGTASLSFGALTEPTPGVFLLEAIPTSSGTLQLQIFAGATLTDLAGNALDTSSAIIDDTTLNVTENTPPIVFAGSDQSASLTGSVDWSPADITTAAWYDASDASTITTSGTNVTGWTDKSGNGVHLEQSSAGDQPALIPAGINGLNVLEFAGRTEQMDAISGIDVKWAAMVLQYNNATPAFATALGDQSLTNYLIQYRGDVATTPVGDRWQGAYFTNGNPSSNVGAAVISAPAIVINDSINLTNMALQVGGDRGIGGRGWDGYIAEVIVGNTTLSAGDREVLEGYLAHKWGLAGSLPADHSHKASAPGGSAAAVVSLNGAASDPEGGVLSTAWTVFSGPAGVAFGDSSSAATTATFTAAGTYVLTLTADDGNSQTSSQVTITVNPPPSPIYTAWAEGSFANTFTGTDPLQDQDGDGMANLMEFAFGTDPTLSSGAALAIDGSAHGSPALASSNGGETFSFYFVRRDDHGTAGSMNYTVQFSSDLVTFYDSAVAPTVVTDSTADPDYEVVKVPFPATLPDGQPARFARIAISDVE